MGKLTSKTPKIKRIDDNKQAILKPTVNMPKKSKIKWKINKE